MKNDVLCESCKQPFISAKSGEQVLDIIKENKLEKFQDLFRLCQKCRRETFAQKLIGKEIQKVNKIPYVAKRRREKIEPVKADGRTGATLYKSQCFICNAGCDAIVWVRDGRVIKVEGDLSSPVTKGTLCAKGLASPHILYHPDRLRYPVKRTGKRGEGKWKRISWDEALDAIAIRFKEIEEKFGKDSIACITGTSRGWVPIFTRFANAWGKQWSGPGVAQCFAPRAAAQSLTLGGSAIECPDYSGTQCMLVWGCNPVCTWQWKGSGMTEAWARGAKLIVVDPVLTESASKAVIWLQLRPGTDAALAMGMLNVIINGELYDKEFVKTWCFGFESLKERVQQFPLGKVEEITWVPENKIIEAAKLYATTKPASITQIVAVDQNADTLSTCRAIAALASITGNIDIPGGNVFPMPLPARGVFLPEFSAEHCLKDCLTKEQHETRLGAHEYPLLSGEYNFFPSAHNTALWKAMINGKPYPVRALYNHGSDILLAFANTNMVMKALMSLDFFVVADLFMNATAELADIVLPAASWLERNMAHANLQVSYNNVHLQQKIVDLDECWSDYKILNEVAKRLGFGHLMFNTEEDYCDFVLEPSGMKWQEFKQKGIISVPMSYKKYERTGFKTPSGKVELYSQTLEKIGYDPLPGYREPTEGPANNPGLSKKYPLILTTGAREPVFRHSELRNIPMLREIWPDPRIKINPKTAGELGIEEEDTIIVETLRGSMEAKAWLREDIDPRVIQVPSHWPGKGNVNLITDNENCAPGIGSAQLRCQLCRVRKG